MSHGKLEDCLPFSVSLGEALRDRHTDIQNDSVFMRASYGIFSTFNSIQTTTDPNIHNAFVINT